MREQPLDNDWVEAFKQGDKRAFSRVYEAFIYQLSYFASKLIGNQPEAEEIASESLRKLMQLHPNFNTLADIRAFLYVTTRNHCYDILRSRVRAPREASLEDESIIDKDELVLNLIIKTEIMEEIYQEIENLPEKRREVFKLYYLDGLKIEEIANRLGTNADVIRSTKSKAVAQLRIALGDRKFLFVITYLLTGATGNQPPAN